MAASSKPPPQPFNFIPSLEVLYKGAPRHVSVQHFISEQSEQHLRNTLQQTSVLFLVTVVLSLLHVPTVTWGYPGDVVVFRRCRL